jgi:antigen flippase
MSAERGLAATVSGRAAQAIVTRIGVALLGFAAGVLIARIFGPSGKGAYNAVGALIAVPAALTSGASAAILFYLVRERRNVRETFPVIVAVFGTLTLACVAGAVLYAALHGWNAVTIALAAVLPATIVIATQESYFVSSSRISRLNALTIALPLLVLIGCGAAILMHASVAAALAAYVAASYVCAAFVVADMLRSAGGWDGRELLAGVRSFLRIAVPSGFSSALGMLNYRVDSYILLGLLGVAPFGIYSVAINGGEMLLWLSRPIVMVMSREIGGSESERSAELAACTIRTNAALISMLGLALALCAPFLVHAIYGGRFAAAAVPLQVLVAGVVAASSFGAFATYFIVHLGKPLPMAAINVAMIFVQSAACLVLVPHYRILGAALACTATYVFGAAASTWWFCRRSGMRPAEVWVLQRRDVARIRNAVAGLHPKLTVLAVRRP